MSKETMNTEKTIAVVGIGLIGGSVALKAKRNQWAHKIIGVDANPEHAQKAMDLNLVDAILPMEEAIQKSDVLVLAIPVGAMVNLLPRILDQIDQQVVIDMGSTKTALIESVRNHPKRGRYVASHPMWGTEYSGPEAAVENAFEEKAVILCDTADSDADALEWSVDFFKKMKMHIIEMTSSDHDLHAAYVSHISHITSFALANTVLEKEKEDKAIFEMASAGFESTVRLAKSNPDMWTPILMQNKENVLDVLNEHITQLRKFKSCLEKENWEYLNELMSHANQIRKIIQ
jgi:prephenate dehydrogenase